MNDVVIASTAADAAAASAVEQHHAQLAGSLALRVEGLVAAATGHNESSATRSRAALVGWCRQELVPHALAEEAAMYPVARARPEARLLVDAMIGEHKTLVGLVDEIDDATDAVRAAVAARALQTLFESHLAKENELVLPLLVGAPDVSLADILGGMHELLGAPDQADTAETEASCGGHSCSCGEVDGAGLPELDARSVPHAIRHATIFGALDAVQPGGGLVLVAPHDPLPLLAQVEQRAPGAFEVDYLERGPEAWRLSFIRSA
jgi:uncharacterized protein (DUF2249 family)/iron-sulfur cluster repair protein YtfE (RIC family)